MLISSVLRSDSIDCSRFYTVTFMKLVLLYYTFLAFSTVEFVVYTFGMKIFPCRVSALILSDCGQEVLCLHRVHRPQARCHAYIEIFPVRFSSSPPQRAVGMQKKLPSLSSAFPPKRKSVPHIRTGFFLHFQSRHDKLPFAVCICTCEENEGLQREHLLAAGFPIGARSIPVGTRFCSAKSSVLYLCFRLTRERGWRRTLRCGRVWQQTLFCGSRTGGFCGVSYSTIAGFLRSKIRLAGEESRGI